MEGLKVYKKLAILLIVIALFIPIFKVNYFNGKTMEIRKYSIMGLLVQDIKDGTMGTGLK